jgi:hypothetical protein
MASRRNSRFAAMRFSFTSTLTQCVECALKDAGGVPRIRYNVD